MMRLKNQIGIFFAALLLAAKTGFAQNEPVEMADGLYQSGKIYVVVAVLSVIFIGIVMYLISIDRKVSRLEKENQ